MLLLRLHSHSTPTIYLIFSSNSSSKSFYTSASFITTTIISSFFLFSPFSDNYSSLHHTSTTRFDLSSAILIKPSFYTSQQSSSLTRSFSNSMIFSFNAVYPSTAYHSPTSAFRSAIERFTIARNCVSLSASVAFSFSTPCRDNLHCVFSSVHLHVLTNSSFTVCTSAVRSANWPCKLSTSFCFSSYTFTSCTQSYVVLLESIYHLL